MSATVSIITLVIAAIVIFAAAANYRKHARKARAKSEAALATLMAETEQIAADARARSSQSGLDESIDATDAATGSANPPTTASSEPSETDPVREAYERGYRQGFLDGMAGSKNRPRS